MNIDFDIEDESKNIKPMAFDPKPTEKDGLSVNWSKYTNAKQTHEEVLLLGKNRDNYGIISLPVSRVRQIPPLVVEHDPIIFPIDNQSHSLVINVPPRKPNDLGVRLKLRDIYQWEIKCPR